MKSIFLVLVALSSVRAVPYIERRQEACSWEGHCLGDPCATWDDCDLDWTCTDGFCAVDTALDSSSTEISTDTASITEIAPTSTIDITTTVDASATVDSSTIDATETFGCDFYRRYYWHHHHNRD